MNAHNPDRMSGAVDQEAFETVMRDNLSPAGVVAIITFLRTADCFRSTNADGERAKREVEWFANTLFDMVGVQEYNHLLDELGL